jgi:HEAT repeat protein
MTLLKCDFQNLGYQTSRGVFIRALDDECSIVREAAINTITEIGLLNEYFAKQAATLLLGMLNDETDQTRIEAVKALCKLHKDARLSVSLSSKV